MLAFARVCFFVPETWMMLFVGDIAYIPYIYIVNIICKTLLAQTSGYFCSKLGYNCQLDYINWLDLSVQSDWNVQTGVAAKSPTCKQEATNTDVIRPHPIISSPIFPVGSGWIVLRRFVATFTDFLDKKLDSISCIHWVLVLSLLVH